MDGRKEINDRTRVDYAGNGSYDRIVPKFQKLVAARGGKDYYLSLIHISSSDLPPQPLKAATITHRARAK